jgi:ribosomal protein L11 methyltransferase
MKAPGPPLYKASVTVPKARAPDIVALFELAPPEPQAVLVAEDPFGPHAVVEALYDMEPDAAWLSRLAGVAVTAEPLPERDWIRQSQMGLPPVRAGRFFLYGAHDAGAVPKGVIPICIEAGLAFGTGHHETTSLCLRALSRIARRMRPRRVLDLGCGTGVLAIGAAALWHVRVLATDIDPIAIAVTHDNARANGTAPLVEAETAEGMDHPRIRARAPFDLIVANILAGPLMRLAPGIARALAPGGTLVLSGLLRNQENLVLGFYRPHGLVFRRSYRDGPWSALVLNRPGV